MHKQMQIPCYHEGWDDIRLVQHVPWKRDDEESYNKFYYGAYIAGNEPASYDTLFKFGQYDGILLRIPDAHFMSIRELSHDNPHHVLSVSRHTYEVYKYLHASEYARNDKWLVWLWTALLHDLGKGATKEFDGKFAHFYGHENVSAQLTIQILHRLGYHDSIVLEVAQFVQMHMRMMQLDGTGTMDKFKQLVGHMWFERLLEFRKADEQAG
jgi:putative nucleotidyltransferase with HDIG domain